MKHYAYLVACGLWLLAPSMVACGELQTSPEAGTAEVVLDHATMFANGTALAIETAQRSAEVTYYAVQKDTLQKSIDQKWPTTKWKHKIAEVRDAWEPVWDAFKKAREAHGLLVKAIDGGESAVKVAELVASLSGHRKALAEALALPASLK